MPVGLNAAMITDERIRLYEQPSLLDAAGGILRPGGLALTDYALAFCALLTGARVLDVGCGPGASVEYLAARYGFTAWGVDPSAPFLRAGRRRSSTLPVAQAYGETLPIATGRIDAVLAECTLSVMQDADRALAEFARVLCPGGWLILSDLYARSPEGVRALSRLPFESCLVGARPKDEIGERVQARGFEVRLWEDRTDDLKVFTARLIWSHGSLPQFWCHASPKANAGDVQAAIAQAKPGYYLLIAQKIGG